VTKEGYLLALPGVRVESCTQVDGKIFLGLSILSEGIVCHHCKNSTEKLHQNRPVLVRDLSVFGRPVYLKIPRRQFYCPSCQRYRVHLSFANTSSGELTIKISTPKRKNRGNTLNIPLRSR
jgi:transposase